MRRPARGGVRADSIAKNTAFSYATQLTTASLTALMTVFLVRALGPAEYGLFALAVSVSSIALGVADAGISYSTARFAAEHRHDRSAVGSLFVNSLKLKLMVTGSAALTLALLATPIANAYGEPDLVWPLRAIAAAMFGQSCLTMLTTVGSSLGRTVENLRIVAIESVLEVTATVGLVLLGAGAAGAAFGRAFGFVLGAVIGLVADVAAPRASAPAALPGRPIDPPLGASAVMPARSSSWIRAYTVSSSVNVLLIGGVMGTAASGIFQAPMKLITFLQYVGLSTANGVAPRLARSHGQEPNVAALRAALRGLIAFQCVLLAPAVVWAGPITGLVLGPGYAGAAGVLTALAPYIFFSGLAPTLTISVNYVGEARRRVPIALATVVLSLGVSALLIPSHGLIGAAVATDVAYGFYTLAHLWLCRRLLNLRLAPLVWSLACALTAAAAMAIVLAEIGTKHLVARRLAPWRGRRRGDLRGDAAVHTRASRPRSRHRLRLPAPCRARRARAAAGPATAGAQAGADEPRDRSRLDAGRLSPADTPGHAPPLAADPGGAAVAEPRPARTRRRGPALHPSVRALEGIYQPQAPTSPIAASPPPVHHRPPSRPRGCREPSPPCAAPRPSRPPPRPPSRPRGLQRTDPPVRRPEPEPPSTPAAEPPAWLQRPTPRCPAPRPSRPPHRPPSRPHGCSAPTPRCAAPQPEPPSTTGRRAARVAAGPTPGAPPRARAALHPGRRAARVGPPVGRTPPPARHRGRRNRNRRGKARRGDSATASPGSDRPTYEITWRGDGETGVFELRPVPPDPRADTDRSAHRRPASVGARGAFRCLPVGLADASSADSRGTARPIRSWSNGCWPKAGSAWGWARAGSRTGCVPRRPPPRATGPPRARPRRPAHVRPEGTHGRPADGRRSARSGRYRRIDSARPRRFSVLGRYS